MHSNMCCITKIDKSFYVEGTTIRFRYGPSVFALLNEARTLAPQKQKLFGGKVTECVKRRINKCDKQSTPASKC